MQVLPEIGEILDETYEIVELIGQGGFGAVYLARQISMDRNIALKILVAHPTKIDEMVERFRREVMAVKVLGHPNTIRIFDFRDREDGTLYYTMEFVNGPTLKEVLRDEGPIAPARTKHILRQVLKSLSEAHSHGIIHRDLKPANVMLADIAGETDYVKVVDFGIAKVIDGDDEKDEEQLTSAGMLVGTLHYMSPEQIAGGDIGPPSDLYALALIGLEMLSGRSVFADSGRWEILHKQISDEPIEVPPIARGTPLAAVLEKALKKKATERYARAEDMLKALDELPPLSAEPLVAGAAEAESPEGQKSDSSGPHTPQQQAGPSTGEQRAPEVVAEAPAAPPPGLKVKVPSSKVASAPKLSKGSDRPPGFDDVPTEMYEGSEAEEDEAADEASVDSGWDEIAEEPAGDDAPTADVEKFERPAEDDSEPADAAQEEVEGDKAGDDKQGAGWAGSATSLKSLPAVKGPGTLKTELVDENTGEHPRPAEKSKLPLIGGGVVVLLILVAVVGFALSSGDPAEPTEPVEPDAPVVDPNPTTPTEIAAVTPEPEPTETVEADTGVPSNPPEEVEQPKEPVKAPEPTAKTVRIVTKGVKAEVFQGSELVGKTPLSLPVSKKTEFTLKAAGYEDATLTLTPDSNKQESVNMKRVAGTTSTTKQTTESGWVDIGGGKSKTPKETKPKDKTLKDKKPKDKKPEVPIF